MKWTEGHIHIAMRRILEASGWRLIAGEYPGGSDHDLYPLNVVDQRVARDRSPDPRRHSSGELIPDLVALKDRKLLIVEAKLKFDSADLQKLETLLSSRRADLLFALNKFAQERRQPDLYPIESLLLQPVLAFLDGTAAPTPPPDFSFLRISSLSSGRFEGALA